MAHFRRYSIRLFTPALCALDNIDDDGVPYNPISAGGRAGNGPFIVEVGSSFVAGKSYGFWRWIRIRRNRTLSSLHIPHCRLRIGRTTQVPGARRALSCVAAETVHVAYAEVNRSSGYEYPFRCRRVTGFSYLERPRLVYGDRMVLEPGVVLAKNDRGALTKGKYDGGECILSASLRTSVSSDAPITSRNDQRRSAFVRVRIRKIIVTD